MAGQRHRHRPPSRRPGRAQGDGADADRQIRGATTNNLREVDVDIPLGVLVVVTGVAGSGKSSLVHGSIPAGAGLDRPGSDPRLAADNPATYTGLLDPIRKAFAKANGVKPASFSANPRAPVPRATARASSTPSWGDGHRRHHPGVRGEGFDASVLEYHFGGHDISEVLAMPVEEAEAFFGDGEARTPAAHKILQRLAEVGLGYPTIGQPLTTLSGGERQGLPATHMAELVIYVLDEPTTGLHLADVEQLLGLLDRLVDSASR